MAITPEDFALVLDRLFARAQEDLASRQISPRISGEIAESMRVAFERSAKRALRRPDPIERSVLLRKVLRYLVPRAVRPWAKRTLLSVLRAKGAR